MPYSENDIRHIVEQLASIIDVSPESLPLWDSQFPLSVYVEVNHGKMHYVYTERGIEDRRSTIKLDELLL